MGNRTFAARTGQGSGKQSAPSRGGLTPQGRNSSVLEIRPFLEEGSPSFGPSSFRARSGFPDTEDKKRSGASVIPSHQPGFNFGEISLYPAAQDTVRPKIEEGNSPEPKKFDPAATGACRGCCPDQPEKKEEQGKGKTGGLGSSCQAKLKVGTPGDRYEQEADRVAERVMNMPEPTGARGNATGTAPGGVRRQEAPEEERETIGAKLLQRQEAEKPEDEEEGTEISAKEQPGQTPRVTPGLEKNIASMRGGGQPLADSSRAFFEPRFGRDFSGVRVHDNSRAAEASQSINARAFTLGRDVFFNTGQYQPHSTEGKRLMAHELTHVGQQGTSRRSNNANSSVHPNDFLINRKSKPSLFSKRWFSKARYYNKKHHSYTYGLAYKINLIANNPYLFDSVKKDKKIGRNFAWLVFSAQQILFPGKSSNQDGKLGPKTVNKGEKYLLTNKTKFSGGIDYNKLLKDKILDIGIAIGSEVSEYENLEKYLKKKKFTLSSPSIYQMVIESIFPGKKFTEKWKKKQDYLLDARGSKKTVSIDINIEIINEETGNKKKNFSRFLSEKEIMIYSGHARMGSGPDFDSKKSIKENFVIGVNSALHKAGKLTRGYSKKFNKKLKKKGNDLEAMSKAGKFSKKIYQIWFFNACTSFNYLDEIRGGLVKGKDRKSLRVIGTKKSISVDAIPFLEGILKKLSMNKIIRQLDKAEGKYHSKKKGDISYFFSD